jgi:hypothetical protein
MEFHGRRQLKKPFREWLLNLCGYEIWPPTHNDPTIKGPPPRILTRRQWEAMEKIRRERESGGMDILALKDRSEAL